MFTITVDNASANNAMECILKRKLQKNLICNGEFFHVRCSAHILNLIVQDGLYVTSGAPIKIRDNVKYVRGSEIRENFFQSCMETVGIQVEAGLILDFATRWNSTHLMLSRSIQFKDTLRNLAKVDKSYKNNGNGKSALDTYLEERGLDMVQFRNLNLLSYWKDNSCRFKELASVACDVLSIPLTTVASESAFSIGNQVLTKYKSCLLHTNVQALICAKNWVRGFEELDDEFQFVEEEGTIVAV